MQRVQILNDLKHMIGKGVGSTDDQLNTAINSAYMYMVDAISDTIPDFFVKSSTTSSVTSQQEYALPSDFEKMLMCNIQIDGTWRQCLPMGNADITHVPVLADTNNQNGFTWANPKYYIYASTIGFMPIPAETTSNNIKIWYVYVPTTLTADSTEPAIPTKYHYLIKYGAFADYLDRNEEYVAAENMRRRYDAMIERMVANLSQRQVNEPRSVEVTENLDLYDLTPRVI